MENYHIHKSPPLVPILNLINLMYTFPPYFPEIHSNIIWPSTPRSYKWPLFFRFSDQNLYIFLLLFNRRRKFETRSSFSIFVCFPPHSLFVSLSFFVPFFPNLLCNTLRRSAFLHGIQEAWNELTIHVLHHYIYVNTWKPSRHETLHRCHMSRSITCGKCIVFVH